MIAWHIGCSGFSYKHWRGKFYPDKLAESKWFAFYNQQFKTLELNVTFYRFPQLTTLQKWYDTSPPNFSFSVKAPRGITHYKLFHNAHDLISQFYDVINNGLREKLGPVLFQMPPRFRYSPENLERVVNSLNPSFKNVLELRDASWWRNDVYIELSKHNITFCGQSHPALPDEIIQNTAVIYYRFHGVPDLYRSAYTEYFLKKVADTISQNNNTKEVWLYFNNDIDVAAIDNARTLIQLVAH